VIASKRIEPNVKLQFGSDQVQRMDDESNDAKNVLGWVGVHSVNPTVLLRLICSENLD